MGKAVARLKGRVVVITGASSGLGREAAVQFARAGCSVVLAARREEDLEETAALCRAQGVEALALPTDVSQESEVQLLLDAALAKHERIDIWVNNAGVTLFARLADAPFEEHRRVIETNLFGAMISARAVIPVFRRQRHGVLINVGSVLSKVGQPFVPSYVISKFGLRGLSEALRSELADLPDVHVCTVLPYAIDTPHFEAGANVVGRQARAMPPTQSPEKVARVLVDLAARPRREVHVPKIVVAGLALHWLFPTTTDRLLLHTLRRWHFDSVPEPVGTGNLYQPTAERGGVHGERPPQIGTARLALWSAGELARMELSQLAQRLKTVRSQLRARVGRRSETRDAVSAL